MKTFIATKNNSGQYLYVECSCGKRSRLNDNMIRRMLAIHDSARRSLLIKRGIEEKRRLGEPIFRVKEVRNGRS